MDVKTARKATNNTTSLQRQRCAIRSVSCRQYSFSASPELSLQINKSSLAIAVGIPLTWYHRVAGAVTRAGSRRSWLTVGFRQSTLMAPVLTEHRRVLLRRAVFSELFLRTFVPDCVYDTRGTGP